MKAPHLLSNLRNMSRQPMADRAVQETRVQAEARAVDREKCHLRW